ncbi:MAG: hypothetical protein J2P43_09380 [Candidatus Dormibacteraeota bacterium]|nr:hypothetical protein [Candidatus Dormibacteraeota bacterium]MBO0745217.1 hypothetical protein [Candidatus Dormibacteraeota bacterium]
MTLSLPLATPGFPNLENLQVPLIGNKWAVGTVFMAHILFGSFTMGTLLTGPCFELVGRWRGSANCLRYATGLAEVNLKIFSIGATIAGFAVIFLAALYGRMWIPLVEIMIIPFAIAFTIWIPMLAALYLYAYKFAESFGHRWHIALGFATAFADHIFLFFIVGVDSFLLTPGSGRGIGAFFNPTFLPEVLHRFTGNMSWSSFFIAAVFAVRAGRAEPGPEREYRLWAARASLVVGFLLLVPQALSGTDFVVQMHDASPGAFQTSFTTYGYLWIAQVSMLCALLLGGSVYFAASRPSVLAWLLSALILVGGVASALPNQVYGVQYYWIRLIALAAVFLIALLSWIWWLARRRLTLRSPFLARGALTTVGVIAVALFLLMGVIRTSARDPYTVFGKITQQQSQGIFNPGPGHYP